MLARIAALHFAVEHLGVHEDPPGSNSGPYVTAWLKEAGVPNHNPWCMALVHAAFLSAGVNLGGGASVGNFEQWGRLHGDLVQHPLPGDVVCYDWNGDGWPDHVGIVDHVASRNGHIVHYDHTVEATHRGDVIAVEGNTSISNDSDGGRVMFRPRPQSVCKLVRIPGTARA